MNKLLINLKSWYGVLILVLLAGGVVWAVLNGMPLINNLRANWEAQRLQAQWEKPYREDTYGGKTPEETYDMFLDALRKGDTTLASKYFVVSDQAKWLKTFEQYKNQSLLESLSAELKSNRNSWALLKNDNKAAIYTYDYRVDKPYTEELPLGGGKTQKVTHPAGIFKAEINFELNTYTKIWKIRDL